MLRYIQANNETIHQAQPVPPAPRNVLLQMQKQNIEQTRTRTDSKEMEPLLVIERKLVASRERIL